MFGSNSIQDFSIQHLPSQKLGPNGWYSFNCPACIHNGEPSLDTKKRMGLYLEANGGLKYHCFRCGFGPRWYPGQTLSTNLRKLFGWLGASAQEIMQLNLECLKLRQNYNAEKAQEEKIIFSKEVVLPKDTYSLEYWANQDNPPKEFLTALEYIDSRNPHLMEWFKDFRWSPEWKEHFIIPLMYHNQLYGWTARLTREPKNKNELKYYLNNESKFLFGAEQLEEPNRNYVIVTEGPLDAIALGGVAIMGNQITDKQLKYLNSTDKQIIVLADKDAGGQKLIDAAQNNGWGVSFPDTTGLKLKDGLDMVNYFGRLMAVKMIFDAVEINHLKISMLRKKWVQ